MPERVVQAVLAEKHGRPRNEGVVYRVRISLALVAAVLVVALVGVATITVNSLRGVSPAANVGSKSLQQLEAIPVTLPVLEAGQTCPNNTGSNSLGYDYGSGPVFVNGHLTPVVTFVDQSGVRSSLYDLTYYSTPDLTGLVLVRGRDLVNSAPIRFVKSQGASFPSDTPPWQLNDQLVLDAGHPPARTANTSYGIWHIRHLIKTGWSGCWGFQIDGSHFSETITGFVHPY
jgi:hypothetical protein